MGKRTVTPVTIQDPDDPLNRIATGQYMIEDTRELSDAIAETLGRLAVEFQARVDAGRNYGGKVFQLDAASLQNINGASSMAMVALTNGGGWPDGFVWIAADNSTLPLTAPAMIAFGMNIGLYYSALVLNNRALKNAIAALGDIAACDSFDVTQGWPLN